MPDVRSGFALSFLFFMRRPLVPLIYIGAPLCGACGRTSGSIVVKCGMAGRMSHRYRFVYAPFSMLQLRLHSCFL